MVKRRKLSGGPVVAVGSPRIRSDVKEENPYLGGGEISANLAIAGTEAEAGEMAVARSRLRGALQEALEQSDVSSESTDDLPLDTAPPPPPRHSIKRESGGAQAMRNLRQQQRRRRRRELLAETAFHHTYVMKLFDRSVDLAQFPEDTPLYPVCRAWMANQPHNTNLVPKLRTPTPEPPEESGGGGGTEGCEGAGEGEEARAKEREKPKDEEGPEGGEEDEEEEELVRDTYRMPPPRPLPSDPKERRRLRVPSPPPRRRPSSSPSSSPGPSPAAPLDGAPDDGAQQLSLDYEAHPPVAREALLREHIAHWTAVRRKWHAAARANSSRFNASARILKAIYRKAQKAFE